MTPHARCMSKSSACIRPRPTGTAKSALAKAGCARPSRPQLRTLVRRRPYNFFGECLQKKHNDKLKSTWQDHEVLRRKVSWSEVERAPGCPRLRLFLLQVCRTLCLRGVGPPHTVQHAVSSPARRDDRKFLHKGGEELSRGNMRTRIFIHTWHLNGARQAKHLECQPEAVEPWKRLVENWLQLRVVTTTREREKKESPSTGKWCRRHRQEMLAATFLLMLHRVSRRPHLQVFTWKVVGNHQTSILNWFFEVPGRGSNGLVVEQ